MYKHNIFYNMENLINGKVYRGIHSTNNLNDWYWGSGILIKKAIKQYGIENFERTILFDYPTREEAAEKEEELVNEEFCNSDMTYNLQPGGIVNYNVSEETKNKMSKYWREHYKSNETHRKGIPHSEESKVKIGNAHRNKTVSEEVRDKISKGMKEYYKTDKGKRQRENISKRKKEYWKIHGVQNKNGTLRKKKTSYMHYYNLINIEDKTIKQFRILYEISTFLNCSTSCIGKHFKNKTLYKQKYRIEKINEKEA